VSTVLKLKEPPDENGIDLSNQILLIVPLKKFRLSVYVPDLILLNGLPESATARLFFSLDQHDKVDIERSPAQQFRRSACSRHDWSFIVRRTSPVQVPVLTR
jgi:hypothetical protein